MLRVGLWENIPSWIFSNFEGTWDENLLEMCCLVAFGCKLMLALEAPLAFVEDDCMVEPAWVGGIEWSFVCANSNGL
jgi:hypothetical protein